MIHSEKIDLIAPALVAAQKVLRSATRSAVNPHLKSKYAPLDEVVQVAREALHQHDIMFSQSMENADATGFDLVTTLLHVSGQWIAGRVRMPLEKQTAQAAGSAQTYGRRYGLSALIGVVPDDDDDGNRALAKPKRAQRDISTFSDADLSELKAKYTRLNQPEKVERIKAEMHRRTYKGLDEAPAALKPTQKVF